MYTTSVSLLDRLQNLLDQQSWQRFVKMYTPLLYSWSLRAGVAARDADDLVQEVFAVIVKELPQFRYDHTRSFRGWLRTVMTNKWRELHRRKQPPIVASEQHTEAAQPDFVHTLAEEEYHRQLVEQALRIMKEDFDPDTWKACWEYVAMDRPPGDVAQELGISVNTVYLAKSRVLRRLRGELAGLM